MKTKPNIQSNKEQIQDIKPNIEFKRDVKIVKTEPGMDKIIYEEEKVALVSLQYGECSNDYLLLVFVMKYVYINTPTPVISAHKL